MRAAAAAPRPTAAVPTRQAARPRRPAPRSSLLVRASRLEEAVKHAASDARAAVQGGAADAGAGVAAAADAAADAATAGASHFAPLPPARVRGATKAQQTNKTFFGFGAAPPAPSKPQTVAARRARGAARLVLLAGGAYAALAVGAAVLRVARARASPRAARLRTVDKNKMVVDTLDALLPADRGALTPAVARRLARATGFTPVELFRKYLWFLLRERKFDGDAVADVAALRDALALSPDDVAAALAERARRVYAQYGTLMLDASGLTAAGIERKATCRALFSKLLFLAESEDVIPQDSAAARALDVAGVFGATEEDAARLRIVSLVETDIGALESQFDGSDEGGGGSGGDGGWSGLPA